MKKIIFSLLLISLSTMAFAQQWLLTEEGSVKNNEDMETGLATVKQAAEKAIKQQHIINPLTKALVRKTTTSIYKKTFKRMQEERYITSYPDGDYTVFGKYDVSNDRVVFFAPHVGRIIIQDYRNRNQIIAFPQLKIYIETDIDKKAPSAVAAFVATKPVPEGVEFIDLNGFRAMENFVAAPVTAESLPENIVVYQGQKVEKFPVAGQMLMVTPDDKFFYPSIYVEASESTGVQDLSKRTTQWEEGNIDPQNFVLPEGYTKAKDIKKLNKQVQKALEDNQLGIEIPQTHPDNFWSCFAE